MDSGLSGTCEADVNAVMSQELCLKLLDKPGFIQDPVPETERGTLIGVHCVCATKLNGWDKPAEPFLLRSHSESNIGVAVQVLWRPGQEVTIMQMAGPDKMLLGKGRVLRNHDTPPAGGCRTSVELEIDGPQTRATPRASINCSSTATTCDNSRPTPKCTASPASTFESRCLHTFRFLAGLVTESSLRDAPGAILIGLRQNKRRLLQRRSKSDGSESARILATIGDYRHAHDVL